MRISSMLAAGSLIAATSAAQADLVPMGAYLSNLVSGGPDWQYETYNTPGSIMSGGVLTQAVTNNQNSRATWFTTGFTGSQTLYGFTGLSANVQVSGSQLQRLIPGTPAGGETPVTGTTSGVSLAWYFEASSGGSTITFMSNAANRLDLNSILNGATATTFTNSLVASNFEQLDTGGPTLALSFMDALNSAQTFGLLITSSTASGATDFKAPAYIQWNWNGSSWSSIQRFLAYGAYSTGSTSIVISNADAIPGPGTVALLGAAGLLGSRRRRD